MEAHGLILAALVRDPLCCPDDRLGQEALEAKRKDCAAVLSAQRSTRLEMPKAYDNREIFILHFRSECFESIAIDLTMPRN